MSGVILSPYLPFKSPHKSLNSASLKLPTSTKNLPLQQFVLKAHISVIKSNYR